MARRIFSDFVTSPGKKISSEERIKSSAVAQGTQGTSRAFPTTPVKVVAQKSIPTYSRTTADVPHGVRSDRQSRRLSKKILAPVVLCMFMVVVGGGYTYWRTHRKPIATAPQRTTPQVVVNQIAQEPTPVVTSHMMFVGDVFWGRAIETAAKASERGAANLFRGLSSEDKKGYDAWIGDMECPVTDKDIPYRTQVDALVFNCRPEYTAEAAKWFDVMTMANNHMADNGGEWGISQTRQNLEKTGIQYFGNFDVTKESDICEVIAINARVDDGSSIHLPVAMCGYQYVGAVEPKDSQLQVMERYARVMPVIAMPHMGVEYRATAEPAKEALYRSMIDHGADIVIGGHPHVVQNSEVYKGRLIAYSTGNFLFDQQILGRDTTETLGVGITMSMKDTQGYDAYRALADTCQKYKDDCLATLERSLTTRPEFRIAYDFAYYDEASGTPVKASQAVTDIIKKRATVDALQDLATAWSPKKE